MFANGPEDRGSIQGCVIPNTQKMVLDTALLSTQRYKETIKDKMEQSSENSCAFPDTLVYYLLKREPSSHTRLRLPSLNFVIYIYIYVCACVCVCVCVCGMFVTEI